MIYIAIALTIFLIIKIINRRAWVEYVKEQYGEGGE